MIRPSSSALSLIPAFACALLAGCAESPTPPPVVASNPGTTSTVQFPEAASPILTKALADRIQPGMAQDAVISILIDAAKGEPSAAGMIEPIAKQSKLNPIRLDLMLTQGKRKLILAFKSDALVDKKQEGLE